MTTLLRRGTAALALLGTPLFLSACDSAEPDDGPGEEELINQVTLTLTPTGGGTPLTIVASASDGLVIDTFSPSSLMLSPGVTYTGSIELRDTANGEDITEEVEEESEEHLFRYAFQPSSLGSVVITDRESAYTSEDENGGDYAVGLTFQVSVAAGASGTGALNAVLYHFDDAPKTSDTATSDEIDVDIAFPVRFQ